MLDRERPSVEAIVKKALELKLDIVVDDGGAEDEPYPKSNDFNEIVGNIGHTEETVLLFFEGPKRIGWMKLIHGWNEPHELIANYTEHPLLEEIYNCQQKLFGPDAEKLEIAFVNALQSDEEQCEGIGYILRKLLDDPSPPPVVDELLIAICGYSLESLKNDALRL